MSKTIDEQIKNMIHRLKELGSYRPSEYKKDLDNLLQSHDAEVKKKIEDIAKEFELKLSDDMKFRDILKALDMKSTDISPLFNDNVIRPKHGYEIFKFYLLRELFR